MGNNYTEQLVNIIYQIKKRTLRKEEMNQVKKAILDYYCAVIVGSQTNVSNRLHVYLKEQDSHSDVNLIGYNGKFSTENAAFLNGTSAHCMDFDDGHSDGSFHPGSVVLSSILSVADELEADSESIIKAIIIGYEISIRISSSIHPSSRKNGFHNTPIAGIFGAVSGVCYIMDMNKTETLSALGIAGSFASGLFAFLGSGSEIKRLHPGKAAKDAVLAVKLVNNSIHGPINIFENENGVFKAFAGGNINKEYLQMGIKDNYLINEIYFKLYPCCRHLHSSIDAIFLLKQKYILDVNKIKSINVGVNEMAFLHRHKSCKTFLDAQMSLPHAIASALYFDELSVECFKPNNIPATVLHLTEKINVYVDGYAEKEYPKKRVSNVNIQFNDGKEYSEQVDIPLGEPGNPINSNQLRKKFISNCKDIIGIEQSKAFIKDLDDWEIGSDCKFLFSI